MVKWSSIDRASGKDSISVAKIVEEHGRIKSRWCIWKYPRMESEAQRLLHYLHHFKGWSVEKVAELGIFEKPSLLIVDGNILLNEGINVLWNLAIGVTATNYGSANARIGVGDGTTAENATQTGLQGTNKAWKVMDAGYPDRPSATQARWQSTFGGTEANFSWQEATVVNAADDTGQNLNRKVQNLGTKASGSTWIAQLTITLS